MRRIAEENPLQRFAKEHVEYFGEPPQQGLVVYEDESESVISENDSPDLDFRFSVNPYRGCVHGCAYCYARPSHEYWRFGVGSDFERRIVVKPRAPELLRKSFEKRSWQGELVVFSGNTDCYQPLELEWTLTRRCLEVCAEYRNPVGIITKSALVERDLDVLMPLSREAELSVAISIPFWDETVARALEPYAPTPERRVRVVRRLAEAGIDVTVLVSPVIPGLSDRDIPRVLEAVAAAGARRASFTMLRLPGSVREVFAARLERHLPLAKEKILARTREVRGGELSDARFFSRMSGQGTYAESIHTLFEQTARRLGLNCGERAASSAAESTFRRPTDAGGQLRLFG
ncbi:MAG: PA0069 family radical SAM protein [Polyangiaceae bacterium]